MSLNAVNEEVQLRSTQGASVPSTTLSAPNAPNQSRHWFRALIIFFKNCVNRIKLKPGNKPRSGRSSQGDELGATQVATTGFTRQATSIMADRAAHTDPAGHAGRRNMGGLHHIRRIGPVLQSAASFVARRASAMAGGSRGWNVMTARNAQVDSGMTPVAPSNGSLILRNRLEAGCMLGVGVNATFDASRMSSRYLVQRMVGRGGNSTVYTAEDDHGETVALKSLQKVNYQDHQRVMLLREVQVQSKLAHPNILGLYGMFSDAEHVYLAMEYAPHGDLFREIYRRDSLLDEGLAATYTRHIAEGLRFCHAKGVIHRDIKPENIIISENGTAKLADFGWCLPPSTGGRSRSVQCGTPDFHAPEMDGRTLYGKEIDMWALGLIVTEMLYRRRPDDVVRGPWWARRVRLPRKGSVSREAQDLIRGLVRRNASQRLSAEEVLAHPWVVRSAEGPG